MFLGYSFTLWIVKYLFLESYFFLAKVLLTIPIDLLFLHIFLSALRVSRKKRVFYKRWTLWMCEECRVKPSTGQKLLTNRHNQKTFYLWTSRSCKKKIKYPEKQNFLCWFITYKIRALKGFQSRRLPPLQRQNIVIFTVLYIRFASITSANVKAAEEENLNSTTSLLTTAQFIPGFPVTAHLRHIWGAASEGPVLVSKRTCNIYKHELFLH